MVSNLNVFFPSLHGPEFIFAFLGKPLSRGAEYVASWQPGCQMTDVNISSWRIALLLYCKKSLTDFGKSFWGTAWKTDVGKSAWGGAWKTDVSISAWGAWKKLR